MFLQVSVILLTGGCLPQCMLGYYTPGADIPPQKQTPPQEQTPPVSKHPPPRSRPFGADTPPLEQTPPCEQTPPIVDTPLEQTPTGSKHPPPPQKQTLRSRHPPQEQTPPGSRHPPQSRHAPLPVQSMLWDTVNARAVRILLECNLVFHSNEKNLRGLKMSRNGSRWCEWALRINELILPGGAVGAAADDVEFPGHLTHRLLPRPGGGNRSGDRAGPRRPGRVPPLTPPSAIYNKNPFLQKTVMSISSLNIIIYADMIPGFIDECCFIVIIIHGVSTMMRWSLNSLLSATRASPVTVKLIRWSQDYALTAPPTALYI